jgi:predicted HAD superfamily Cof-like phosphohydrolase
MEGTNFELAGDFMEAFGQEVRDEPRWPDFSTRELRLELIREEVEELQTGIENQDLVEIADALTDILYVVYGAGHAFGIDLDACYAEVHASNMSKLGEDGKPMKREDGKVMKGPNYFEPDLGYILGL